VVRPVTFPDTYAPRRLARHAEQQQIQTSNAKTVFGRSRGLDRREPRCFASKGSTCRSNPYRVLGRDGRSLPFKFSETFDLNCPYRYETVLEFKKGL
jgi:hypothetical protein